MSTSEKLVSDGNLAEDVSSIFRPSAVTLVGASEKSHVTRVLLANFTRDDCPFPGVVNLVNPNQSHVFGRSTVPSLHDVKGDLGLVYLLVGAGACLSVLEEAASLNLGSRMAGVIVYAAGFSEAGATDEQAQLAAVARRLGVPMLGPQSTGVISSWSGLLGITDPVPEHHVNGRVGFIAQSTGLLGGAVSWLYRRGIGLGAGVGFGNGATVGYEELGSALLKESDIDVVCIYVDAIGDIKNLTRLGVVVEKTGKPTILLSGAGTPAAQRAARSHTGTLATPQRIVRGVAEQHGILLVDDFEQLLWAAELFVHPGARKVKNPGVGIFTASGGGGIIAAEAIEKVGLPLNAPTAKTRATLGLTPEQLANPFDIGAISLDRPEDYKEKVRVYASDDRFGVIVRPSSLGAPSERLSDHRGSLVSFMEGVLSAGKLPVVAFPFREDPREYSDVITWPEALVVGGSEELGTKLSLLHRWAARAHRESIVPLEKHPANEEGSVDESSIADLETTRQLLNIPGLRWPRSVLVGDPHSLPDALAEFGWKGQPLVAKTTKALPHRAMAGGVLLGLASFEDIAAAQTFLHARFQQPTVLYEEVTFKTSFFVGLQRMGQECLLAFGAGTANNDSDVATRLCPIDERTAARLVADACEILDTSPPKDLVKVLVELSKVIVDRPEIDVVDINPLVQDRDGHLIVLDAKVYVDQRALRGEIGVV